MNNETVSATPLTGKDINVSGTDPDKDARLREGAAFIKTFALPALIYAAIFPFALYQNNRGVATLLFFAATIALLLYTIRNANAGSRRCAYLPLTLIALIGASVFLTDNSVMIFLDYVAVFLLTVSVLLYAMADVNGYSLSDYLYEMARACFGAVGKLFSPFSDMAAFISSSRSVKENTSGISPLQTAGGLLAGAFLVTILAGLLSSADAVFRHMLDRAFSFFTLPDNVIAIAFYFLFSLFSSYCGIRYFTDKKRTFHAPKERGASPLPAVVALTMVSALYLVFSVTQILYLFIGKMTLPYNYTYAEYAREGFFQLLFVCVLNLFMVLFVKKTFRMNPALKVLLTVISACTYIMIASSAMRMCMYVSAYALTFTRVFVFVALFTLAVLFAGVIVMIYRPFNFFRYSLVSVGIIFTLFTYSHSEFFIAKYNLSRSSDIFRNDRHIHNIDSDLLYISRLSTDAAPAIASFARDYYKDGIVVQTNWYYRYLENHGMPYDDAKAGKEIRLAYEDDTLREFNVSRYMAVKLFRSQ